MLQSELSFPGYDSSPQFSGVGNGAFMCIEPSKISLLAIDSEANLPLSFRRYPIDVFGELPISGVKRVIDEPKIAPPIVQPIMINVIDLHITGSGEKHSVHLADPAKAIFHQVGNGVLPGFDAGLLNGPTVVGQKADIGNVDFGSIHASVPFPHFDNSDIALNVNFAGSISHGKQNTPKADGFQERN